MPIHEWLEVQFRLLAVYCRYCTLGAHTTRGTELWKRRCAEREDALLLPPVSSPSHRSRPCRRRDFHRATVELDTGHARKSFFHLRVEFVCSRGDSRRADVLVKT